MLSIVISNNRTTEDINNTLKSICNSCFDKNSVNIYIPVFVDNAECDSIFFNTLKITEIKANGRASSAVLYDIINMISGDYVIFANSGDIFTRGFFDVYNKIISSDINNDYKNIIAFNSLQITYDEVSKYLKYSKKLNKRTGFSKINLNVSPELVPLETTGIIFKINALRSLKVNIGLKYDMLKDLMLRLLNRNSRFISVSEELYISPYPITTDKVNFLGMHDSEWYMESLENFILPLIKECCKNNNTKTFVQYSAIYELRWRFIYNLNSDDKHIVEKTWDKFYGLCKSILSNIDNEIIFNLYNVVDYKVVKGLSFAMLFIKYDKKIDSLYFNDKKSIIRACDDIAVMHAKDLRIILEILEYKDNKLIIEASIDDFMDMTQCGLECYFDSKQIKITPTYRYAHTKYFGISTNKRYTFKIEIPVEILTVNDNHSLRFYITYNDFKVQLSYVTRRYTAMVASNIPYSYWKFADNDRAVCFNNDNNELVFTQIKGLKRFCREIKMIISMLYGKQRSFRMFFTRICYWLTRPYFKNKKIWITYDKLYKGGDCGEYFYKYMLSKNDGITPAYVINKDCEDAKRLRKEGLHPLYYGTMKNKLYYLNADVVFATHGGVHSFNGISNSQVKYVSDLIHADVTCIQHGLSVQQLAQELNRVYNNTKRYYCASKYEIKNLEHPIYGYEDKSILKLTGIPRYDGLVSNDCKQILITPTWRAYISMPPVMGQSRPYYPEFKHTNYYKIYYKLLTDKKLIDTAHRTGYKLIYLLHPIISSQIVDYPNIDGVEIIPATTVNYEKILTESSLMLTDYSGVQFDFAYMRKPVVYYHPPKLPPHYKEGGFFYDSMGFGEICTEHQEMVDCLCEYMENSCQLKPLYKQRADDFFAYSDLNSCERIYNDMVNYQKENGKF